MASISKRGKSWQARISYKTPDGEHKVKTKGGFSTKKAAESFASEFNVNRENGLLVSSQSPLFKDYFWTWFETYKESSVGERTYLTYQQSHKILEENFPYQKLDKMDRYTFQKFIKNIGATRSKETMVKLISHYHACIRDAVYDGLIPKDFIEKTTLVFNEKKVRSVHYLNEKEINTLFKYLQETRDPKAVSKYMILTALATGMRPGEVEGLRWTDINANFHTFTLHQAWNETGKKFQPLKNENSYRTIRVNSWLIRLLEELPKDDTLQRVFGDVPTSSGINTVLRTALKNCDISAPGFTLQSCRHAHVAYLLAHGVDLYAISKRLGHSSMTITANRYAYLIDELKAKADAQIVNSIDLLNDDEENNPNLNLGKNA